VRRKALPIAIALLAAGCGAERPSLPSAEIPAKAATTELSYPRFGIAFEVPQATQVQTTPRPEVARVSFDQAFVAVYAYRREEQLPRDEVELSEARRRLVEEVRRRDERFELVSSRLTRVDGAPAVELVGDQTITRARLRTRSLHVYKGEVEYVFDMAAPVGRFRHFDSRFFDVAARSLTLRGRIERR
jgi:hypothetical protein